MKKHLLAVIFMLSAVAFVQAQNRQAIINVMNTQREAWNRGDLEGFMQGYWRSDSLMFVGKTAPTYGWQNTLNNYKRGYPDKAAMGILTFDILKVDVLDTKNAFVFGGWHVKQATKMLEGYYTLWFKKINGKWVIVCDHTS
ncbi:YybH family protein [Mucilaginibacter panaciglaebae]|uniref:Nuclear transport factor 2 family protein n=1 Tax=Mucilaginibacter panaciglaebae TaxID=502331 RepID=A0ABP7WX11_9SPHI